MRVPMGVVGVVHSHETEIHMNTLTEALMRLLAQALKARWALTGREFTDPTTGKVRKEYAILAPEQAQAGDAVAVINRTAELAVFVLTERFGWHEQDGVRSGMWRGSQLNPVTGQPVEGARSRASITLE